MDLTILHVQSLSVLQRKSFFAIESSLWTAAGFGLFEATYTRTRDTYFGGPVLGREINSG